MKKYYRISIAFVLIVNLSRAFAVIQCPDPPSQISKDTKTTIDLAIGKLAKVSAVQGSVDVQRTTLDLLSRVPQADRIYLEQMMFSAFCSSVRDSTDLTDAQKSKEILKYAIDLRNTLQGAAIPMPSKLPHQYKSKEPMKDENRSKMGVKTARLDSSSNSKGMGLKSEVTNAIGQLVPQESKDNPTATNLVRNNETIRSHPIQSSSNTIGFTLTPPGMKNWGRTVYTIDGEVVESAKEQREYPGLSFYEGFVVEASTNSIYSFTRPSVSVGSPVLRPVSTQFSENLARYTVDFPYIIESGHAVHFWIVPRTESGGLIKHQISEQLVGDGRVSLWFENSPSNKILELQIWGKQGEVGSLLLLKEARIDPKR